MKLYVREVGTSETRARVGEASLVATSRVAYPEARAALARRQREAAITQRALDRAVSALDRDLGRFVVVELSAKVARRAGDLAERRGLRGFDAIHLASALEVEELTGLMPGFFCYDVRLREAASGEGLPAPRSLASSGPGQVGRRAASHSEHARVAVTKAVDGTVAC